MKNKRNIWTFCIGIIILPTLLSCLSNRTITNISQGGELTGIGGDGSFREPTPFGMTLIKRGWLRMGSENSDSLWGKQIPTKDISVDGFWMDETEVTNSK